ncbi:response regulator transcription factor, partial [Kibdelosporangium lantanae]
MRVVLGEDLVLLRDGLIRMLSAYDFEVVEAVDNGPSLLNALVTHKPDVAVVDVRMPPRSRTTRSVSRTLSTGWTSTRSSRTSARTTSASTSSSANS